MAGPLEQFEIVRLIPLPVGGLDLSFTNSALHMVLAVVLAAVLLVVGMRGRAMVPGRLQSMAEILYELVAGMVKENAGEKARPYFPFIFSLFVFVLFGNLLGLIPTAFTFTSHIIVTFSLAMVVFLFVTVLGIARHGLHFFHLFLPEGTPLWLAPLVVPIEVISYFVRPISLSVRLFANMLAGHTMLKVFAGFSVSLAGMGAIGAIGGLVPVALNVALFALEFLVAGIQAYVFALLSCVYLRDSLELH
ncbi:F0F1 ATP synthase subunit A [Indioceanicola profundi]|uniref:F0F1 ATP synthase subunit A n=1 Tax=Indioceanicola profundi TaxID=2220096 RepID=UPI001CED52B9|nr:F0F1 ATP synthase subunit A [Indioceanicola profundi]